MLKTFLNAFKNCEMSTLSRKCYLQLIGSDIKIELPHDQSKTVGRSRETQIVSKFVSKNQIECVADVINCTVQIKPLGCNISAIDGYAIIKGRTYKVGHGHRIELLLENYVFEINFEPPPDKEDLEPFAKKPKLDLQIDNKWESIDNEILVFTSAGVQSKSKIASFDLDGTLIKTKSQKRFPINFDDWILNNDKISDELKKLQPDYKIVIFTNQSGVGKDPAKIKEFKRKIENIQKSLDVPIQAFVALGKGTYRKPCIGMWEMLQNDKNDGIKIEISESFYVGDAAGRIYSNKKKDHSLVDRLFALNLNITFYTPEEFFLNQQRNKTPFNMPEFDPKSLPTPDYPDLNYESPNIILMVGLPGSGKSHFCKKVLIPKGYIVINRDTLGTWQKCVKALEDAIKENKDCVVDNTNLDKESRRRFLDVAKTFNVKCRCFLTLNNINHVRHNNKFREMTDKTHVPVSDVIIYSARKNFQEPELGEGFEEIVNVPFVPEFKNEKFKSIYNMYLLEK